MDLQEYLEMATKASRASRMENSDQLTLGEMILKLEPIVARQGEVIEKYKEEAKVEYDFGRLFPTTIDSWRGSYAELALDYTEDDSKSEMKVSDFLQMLKDAVGKTFEGYKGGDFTMNKRTPVWVANYGKANNTAVIDIVDGDYFVMIVTGYMEY